MDRTLTLEVNGKSRDLFMSFGLLNELIRLIGEVERVSLAPVDHDLRNSLLKAVFAERSKAGRVTQEVDLDDLDIDPMDVPKVLAWVTHWVIDFFIQSGEAVKGVFVATQDRVKSLTSLPTGIAA